MNNSDDWNLLVCMLEAYKHDYRYKASHIPQNIVEQTIRSDIDPWINYAKEQEEALLTEEEVV